MRNLDNNQNDNKSNNSSKNIFKNEIIDKNSKYMYKIKIFITLLLIFSFTIYINLFRPLIIILNFIFAIQTELEKQGNTDQTELEKQGNTDKSYLLIIGIILIIISSLVPFGFYLCEVLCLTNKFLSKIYYGFLLLIESVLDFPLTFLYNSNRHSIFLLLQDGPEQILNPWLIFFPTNYIISPISLVKNILISSYFIFVTIFIKINVIDGTVEEFSTIFKNCVLAFNIINLFGIILILIFIIIFKKKKKEKNN